MGSFLEVRFLRGAQRIRKVCKERLKRIRPLMFHSSQISLTLGGIISSVWLFEGGVSRNRVWTGNFSVREAMGVGFFS